MEEQHIKSEVIVAAQSIGEGDGGCRQHRVEGIRTNKFKER